MALGCSLNADALLSQLSQFALQVGLFLGRLLLALDQRQFGQQRGPLRVDVGELQRRASLQRIGVAKCAILAQRFDLGQAFCSLGREQFVPVLCRGNLGVDAMGSRRYRACAQRLDLLVALVGQRLLVLLLLLLEGTDFRAADTVFLQGLLVGFPTRFGRSQLVVVIGLDRRRRLDAIIGFAPGLLGARHRQRQFPGLRGRGLCSLLSSAQ